MARTKTITISVIDALLPHFEWAKARAKSTGVSFSALIAEGVALLRTATELHQEKEANKKRPRV